MKEKVGKIRNKQYIESVFVLVLTCFFTRTFHTCMVYDASISSMNTMLWAPTFLLPTVGSLVRATTFDTWMGDMGIGEKILNFALHKRDRPLFDVDLTCYFRSGGAPEASKVADQILWEYWDMYLMGMTALRHNCT